jgi:hypothetical protein
MRASRRRRLLRAVWCCMDPELHGAGLHPAAAALAEAVPVRRVMAFCKACV